MSNPDFLSSVFGTRNVAISVIVQMVLMVSRTFVFEGLADKLAKGSPSVQPRRLGRALHRFAVHTSSLVTHAIAGGGASVYIGGGTASFWFCAGAPSALAARAIYAPAILWALLGTLESWALKAKGGEGEGKDMALHHVVTIVLLVVSYWMGIQCYGAAVLATHAVAEPFIDCYRISQAAPKLPRLFKDFADASSAIMFPITRVIVFGYSCVVPLFHPTSGVPLNNIGWIICHVMMYVMFFLQVYWSGIMIRKAAVRLGMLSDAKPTHRKQ